MRTLLLAAALVLAAAIQAHAQAFTVSGTVVDESAAVVPGASVVLTGPGGQTSATTAGVQGEYTFRNLAVGVYRLTVTLAGFSPATREVVVEVRDVVVPPITLAVAGLGETVVVSASKIESSLVNAPATMTVVTSEKLATIPGQNYADLLRSVPGLNVIQLSARDANITNRQATSTISNSDLVLLDGRSLVLDFFGLVLWDFVPSNTSDIKQIEVIRGPASAVWGASALTGLVNIITKTPREAPGTTVTFSGGLFSRGAGSTVGRGPGVLFGANATVAAAPNDRWSYRVSAGYFNSDPLPRPVGRIPVIQDPRSPTATVGGGFYPADTTGPAGTAFPNAGTSQPKFDLRVDQETGKGRFTYAGGVAGTEGLIHTGLGPFDIQPGSYMAYGKALYSKGALKVAAYANLVDAKAPSVLLDDPATGRPLSLNFSTNTYDVEVADARVFAKRHILSFGGNARHSTFDITVAPTATSRSGAGGYVQDEIFFPHVRFTIGARVDKFDNIADPVFSPRLTLTLKPAPDHAIRVSYNQAFRAPSMINEYEDINIVVPTDLSGLAALLPEPLRPLVAAPFPLVVRAVGSTLPIGTTPQQPLREESLTAYELAYTGTFRNDTMVAVAFYVNDLHDNINFSQLANNLDPYTAANPPPGWLLPPAVLAGLAQQGIFLPRTAFTYLNLGPLRQKGVEVSVDHRFSPATTGFANYSWQGRPKVLDAAEPFPSGEIAIPPTHRFNAGFSFNRARLIGSASVNYTAKAFWSDVLSAAYHGYTDAYTLVNGSFGVKWPRAKIVTSIKVTNLLNAEIQQHVFGDLIKRSGVAELRFTF